MLCLPLVLPKLQYLMPSYQLDSFVKLKLTDKGSPCLRTLVREHDAYYSQRLLFNRTKYLLEFILKMEFCIDDTPFVMVFKSGTFFCLRCLW